MNDYFCVKNALYNITYIKKKQYDIDDLCTAKIGPFLHNV